MKRHGLKIGAIVMAAALILIPVSSASAKTTTGFIPAEEVGGRSDAAILFGKADSEADEDSTAAIVPAGVITVKYVVTASTLKVRSGRGTDYPIIGTLKKGQTVKVYRNSMTNGWVKIKFDGDVGFVNSAYLEKK